MVSDVYKLAVDATQDVIFIGTELRRLHQDAVTEKTAGWSSVEDAKRYLLAGGTALVVLHDAGSGDAQYGMVTQVSGDDSDVLVFVRVSERGRLVTLTDGALLDNKAMIVPRFFGAEVGTYTQVWADDGGDGALTRAIASGTPGVGAAVEIDAMLEDGTALGSTYMGRDAWVGGTVEQREEFTLGSRLLDPDLLGSSATALLRATCVDPAEYQSRATAAIAERGSGHELESSHYWVNNGDPGRALSVLSGLSPVGDPLSPAVQRALLSLTPYCELPSAEVMADVPNTPAMAVPNATIDKVIGHLPTGRARGTLLTNYELIRATFEAGAQAGWRRFFKAFAAGTLVAALVALITALRAVLLAKGDGGWRPLGIGEAERRVGCACVATQ